MSDPVARLLMEDDPVASLLGSNPAPELGEDEIEDEPPGFFSAIGDIGRVWKAAWNRGKVEENDEYGRAVLDALKRRAGDSFNSAKEFVKESPFGIFSAAPHFMLKMGAGAVKGIGEAAANPSILSQIPAGLVRGFAGAPTEAITGLKVDREVDGGVRPLTPDEMAKAFQESVGFYLSLGTAVAVEAKALGGLNRLATTSSDEIFKLSQASKIGTVGKAIAADFGAGLTAGVVEGSISAMGEEDQFAQITASALTFAPVGALFGAVRGRGIVKQLEGEVLKRQAASQAGALRVASQLTPREIINNINGGQLAAIHSLKVGPDDTVIQIIGKVEATASAENAVRAAIDAGVDVGDGFVALDLADDFVKEMEARGVERTVVEFPEIEGTIAGTMRARKVNFQSKPVQFESGFDRLAWWIQSQKKKGGGHKDYKRFLEEAQKVSGLNEEEIVSHGAKVRAEVVRLAKEPGKIRTQEEIDLLNETFRQAGEDKVRNLTPGVEVKDYAGDVWYREGDVVINKNSGLRYAADSRELQLKLGRNLPEGDDALSNIIAAPKLSAKASGLKGGFKVYRGAGNVTLFTRLTLEPKIAEFFQKTGFMPEEMVYDGKTGRAGYVVGLHGDRIRIKSITGPGKEFRIKMTDVRRPANPKLPSTQIELGDTGVSKPALGIASPITYFNHLYNDFRANFNIVDVPAESWDNAMKKFLVKHNLRMEDKPYLEAAFYRNIAADVLDVTDPEEVRAMADLRKQLEDASTGFRERIGGSLYTLMRSSENNGFFIEGLGGGKWAIKFADGSGNTLGIVSSAEEGIALINKTHQAKGMDLDGGGTGAIPPESMNPFSSDVSWKDPGKGNWVDKVNVGTVSSIITPSNNFAASIDNLMGGRTEVFANIYRPLQDGLLQLKAFLNGPAKILVEEYEAVRKFARASKLTQDQLDKVSDYIETLSRDEIINGLLTRKLNPLEITEAKFIASTVENVEEVTNLLIRAREKAGRGGEVGSKKFMESLTEVINTDSKLSKEVATAARRLVEAARQNSQDTFSAMAVMRLAQAEQFPESSLTRVEFIGKHKLTPEQIKLGNMLDAFYRRAADVFGIPPESRILGYSPHTKLAYATGHKIPQVNPEWARDMHRFGLMDKSLTVRDPLELGYRYLVGGARYKSGMMDVIKRIEDDVLPEQLEIISNFAEAEPNLVRAVELKVREHLADVKGIPGAGQMLTQAVKRFFGGLVGLPSVETILGVVNLSTQGGRPVMGIRDLTSASLISYAAFGAKFTKKMLSNSLSKEYMLDLERRGVIPVAEPMDIISPQSESMIRTNTAFKNAMDFGFEMSGQKAVYNRLLAGVYKTTVDTVHENLRKVTSGQLTLKQAYERIGLSVHTPAVSRKFHALVQAGKPDEAATFLGKWNGKFIVNHFGNFNAPQGWNNTPGRLLGQFGSWSTNAIQTSLDLVSRGSVSDRWIRGSRLVAANALLFSAGYAAGINIWNWLWNPLTFIPTGGMLLSELNELQLGIGMSMSPDGESRELGLNTLKQFSPFEGINNLGQFYIPGSYALEDWMKAYKLIEETDADLFQVGMQFIGTKPILEQ